MNYEYEYIKLKSQHERLKLTHDAKIQKLMNQMDDLRAEINQPIRLPKFDVEMEEVCRMVASVTNVLAADIVSSKRHRDIVTARALFCYICRMHLNKQLSRIGVFINRDHSSVLHLVKNYTDYLKMNYKLETRFYNECIDRINNGTGNRTCPYCLSIAERSHLLCNEVHEARLESV